MQTSINLNTAKNKGLSSNFYLDI